VLCENIVSTQRKELWLKKKKQDKKNNNLREMDVIATSNSDDGVTIVCALRSLSSL